MAAKAETLLKEYQAKRDFTKTQEPSGKAAKSDGKAYRFVVQKHDATRLHYDFRLELDGVLKSWAVTKGPSLIAGEKRLAVHTEDHPLDYGTFEGTIPKGQYGGGTVLLWDRGHWQPEEDPHQGLKKGHLKFRLHGEKLGGSWHLVRMRQRPRERQEGWLLFKSEDEAARGPGEPDILEAMPLSVKTGRSLEEIAADAGSAVWQSNRSSAADEPVADADRSAGNTGPKAGRAPALRAGAAKTAKPARAQSRAAPAAARKAAPRQSAAGVGRRAAMPD